MPGKKQKAVSFGCLSIRVDSKLSSSIYCVGVHGREVSVNVI